VFAVATYHNRDDTSRLPSFLMVPITTVVGSALAMMKLFPDMLAHK